MRSAVIIGIGVVIFAAAITCGQSVSRLAAAERGVNTNFRVRADVLVSRLAESIAVPLASGATTTAATLLNRFASTERVQAAVYDRRGRYIMSSGHDASAAKIFPEEFAGVRVSRFISAHDDVRFVTSMPVVVGGASAAVAVSAGYIPTGIGRLRQHAMMPIMGSLAVFVAALAVLLYWVFFVPKPGISRRRRSTLVCPHDTGYGLHLWPAYGRRGLEEPARIGAEGLLR